MANLWLKFRCLVLDWHRPALPAVRDGIADYTHCEDCGVALVGINVVCACQRQRERTER